MSDKSQRHKGKHSAHSKKSKAIERSKSPAPHQPIVPSMPALAAAPAAPAHRAGVTASKTVRYPFITAELKRIGIMAGIILVVLIVLALVLS